MSDEEKSLQDGTHELFTDKDSTPSDLVGQLKKKYDLE